MAEDDASFVRCSLSLISSMGLVLIVLHTCIYHRYHQLTGLNPKYVEVIHASRDYSSILLNRYSYKKGRQHLNLLENMSVFLIPPSIVPLLWVDVFSCFPITI